MAKRRSIHPILSLLLLSFTFFPVPTLTKRSFHEIQEHNHLQHVNDLFDLADASTNQRGQAEVYPPFNPPVIYNSTVDLPINHFGQSPAPYTFPNRFWVVDEYYRPGGPVFVFDTGEAEDAYDYRNYLLRDTSFFNKYLREFGALGVLWEHRYYGESTPYKIDLNTTAENMRWLTTEQALEDFAVFARGFKWRIGGPGGKPKKGRGVAPEALTGKLVDLRPKGTPWVVVGGSYPGMRAAMLRAKYPEVVYAAYASSAPVQASIDMSFYWEPIYRGMVANGLSNCTKNIKSAVDYIDKQLDKPDTSAAIKVLFLGRTGEKNSNEVFSDTLANALYGWQSGGPQSVTDFCNILETGNSASDKGKTTAKVLAERWAKWPGYIQMVNDYNPQGYCEGFDANTTTTVPNCFLDGRFQGVLSISWAWQSCSEWGFFQATNIGPHALGSRYQSLQHQQNMCYRQFPDGLSSGYLPRVPRAEYMNAKFSGWNMRPSNTFWTGGEFDPWRTLSPLSSEKFSPKFTTTEKIPKCGVSPVGREPLFGYLLRNAQHCDDFNPPDYWKEAEKPQRLFAAALKEWLGCFGKN